LILRLDCVENKAEAKDLPSKKSKYVYSTRKLPRHGSCSAEQFMRQVVQPPIGQARNNQTNGDEVENQTKPEDTVHLSSNRRISLNV
jgi:hypothetical protein